MAEQAKTQDKPQELGPKNPEQFKIAIEKGKEVIAEGSNKVPAALVIYDMLKNEHRDVI